MSNQEQIDSDYLNVYLNELYVKLSVAPALLGITG